MLIRPATAADLPLLCELCAQLGYPADSRVIAGRLADLQGRPDHLLIVADEGGALGFADAFERRNLAGPPMAELESLVVLDTARGKGVGAKLLAAVENWAHQRKLAGVNLGSRVARRDAHRFYEREGYTRAKEQAIYRKVFP